MCKLVVVYLTVICILYEFMKLTYVDLLPSDIKLVAPTEVIRYFSNISSSKRLFWKVVTFINEKEDVRLFSHQYTNTPSSK